MANKTELVGMLSACVVAVVTVGGFGYYLGRDTATSEVSQLTRELELLKSAHGVRNALDYLEDLSTYNDNLFRFSEHEEKIAEKNKVIKEMSFEILELEQNNKKLNEEIVLAKQSEQASEKLIAELKKNLARQYDLNETISLGIGQSYSAIGGTLLVGVQSIYSNRAVITLQNDTKFLDVGESVEVRLDTANCLVALRSTQYEKEASLDLSCKTNEL